MDPDRDHDKRAELLKLWHEYGKTYNVFVTTKRPAPRDWATPLPEPDDEATWNPQTIKHWRFLKLTKRFLKTRYGVLFGPALVFDCQVPEFQERLSIEITEPCRKFASQWRSSSMVRERIGNAHQVAR